VTLERTSPAGRLKRAQEADEAEKVYLEKAIEKVDRVDPEHLAKNALAIVNAKSHNVEVAQLLRNQPTAIVETRSVEELMGVLIRAGVIEVSSNGGQSLLLEFASVHIED
jgi:hypothetical protein